MFRIVEFILWSFIVQQSTAFFLGLMSKWGWLEWLQVHAPNDFFNKMFNCKFCCSWWMGIILSLTLCAITGHWYLLLIPICSTPLAKELW